MFVFAATLLTALLFGCSQNDTTVSSQKRVEEILTPDVHDLESPSNKTDEEPRKEALMVPYDISEFVNRDFIFKAKIVSVETVYSTLTYKGEVQDTYEESLLKVQIDEVYAGAIQDDRTEITLYCPKSNTNSNNLGHTLSPGKTYIFFAMAWSEELIAEFTDIGYDKYGYNMRSDLYLPTNDYSMFIANGGYVFAETEWGDVITPTYSGYSKEYWDFSESLKKGYFAKDESSTGGTTSLYSDEDFRKAFEQLREHYDMKRSGLR